MNKQTRDFLADSYPQRWLAQDFVKKEGLNTSDILELAWETTQI